MVVLLLLASPILVLVTLALLAVVSLAALAAAVLAADLLVVRPALRLAKGRRVAAIAPIVGFRTSPLS